jgi:hypothetical protein
VPAGPRQPPVLGATAESVAGSDVASAATWAGLVHVGFVTDVYAGRSVGGRASPGAHAAFVPDALEQALDARRMLEPIGTMPAAEADDRDRAMIEKPATAA